MQSLAQLQKHKRLQRSCAWWPPDTMLKGMKAQCMTAVGHEPNLLFLAETSEIGELPLQEHKDAKIASRQDIWFLIL